MVGVLPLCLAFSILSAQGSAAPQATPRPAASVTPTPSAYVIGRGDVLEIQVLDQADASRSATVQSDGRITMALLGEVEVAGKTVAEVQRIITDLLGKDFLVNPRVEVRVRDYASQFVLVFGEVKSPGMRPLRGNTRLIDTLMESGGFSATASGDVTVQRTDGTLPNGTKVMRFHLTSVPTEATQLSGELVLKHGDIVTAGPKYFVTVDGEVVRPGRVVLENDLTLLAVIAESGGLAKFGSSKVRVIRKKAEGVDLAGFQACEGATKDVCQVIDINSIRSGKVQDLLLAPNDKVVVSRRKF